MQPRASAAEVELPIGCEGLTAYQVLTNSECRRHVCPGVRARVLTSASERETTQTAGQGPELGAELNKTKWRDRDSQDVGLEAAIHLKSA